jgi:hypothetical protein
LIPPHHYLGKESENTNDTLYRDAQLRMAFLP